MLRAMGRMMPPDENAAATGPPQNLREYDPEWARAFLSGTATVSCDHASMLGRVRVPVLFTHHFRTVDERTGRLVGASSDQQARRVCELVTEAGGRIDYRSFPDMPHSMHEADPKLFTGTVVDWVATLDRDGG
jgi:pimeloyl-ACP methyl ester carboxylesterase